MRAPIRLSVFVASTLTSIGYGVAIFAAGIAPRTPGYRRPILSEPELALAAQEFADYRGLTFPLALLGSLVQVLRLYQIASLDQ
jgi:hypothetical protein